MRHPVRRISGRFFAGASQSGDVSFRRHDENRAPATFSDHGPCSRQMDQPKVLSFPCSFETVGILLIPDLFPR
jgi:hypothetical protein